MSSKKPFVPPEEIESAAIPESSVLALDAVLRSVTVEAEATLAEESGLEKKGAFCYFSSRCRQFSHM